MSNDQLMFFFITFMVCFLITEYITNKFFK